MFKQHKIYKNYFKEFKKVLTGRYNSRSTGTHGDNGTQHHKLLKKQNKYYTV